MFTGLIREIGTVRKLERHSKAIRMSVDCPQTAENAEIGDSISISGVCLTVIEVDRAAVIFDVSAQTAEITTLAQVKVGDFINVEPAIAAGDKFGGHFVQGHVDTKGVIKKIKPTGSGDDGWIEVVIPKSTTTFVHDRSSIAVDGISLTVQQAIGTSFTCVIVPHTWNNTVLKHKMTGQLVNIEFDMLIKAVNQTLSGIISGEGGLTAEKLKDWGY